MDLWIFNNNWIHASHANFILGIFSLSLFSLQIIQIKLIINLCPVNGFSVDPCKSTNSQRCTSLILPNHALKFPTVLSLIFTDLL